MGLAGAGFGAAQSLEEIVAQRILAQKLEAEIANRQQQTQMEQTRLNEMLSQNDFDRKRTERLDAERATERTAATDTAKLQQRGRSNMAGVIAMGVDPATAKREIAYSALQSGASVPGGVLDAITPAKPERDPIADHRAKAEIDAQFRPKPQGPAPLRTPQWVRMGDGSVVDINGIAPKGSTPYDEVAARTSAPVNSAEAADTAREAARIATALKDHPGMPGAFGVVDSMMPTMRQSTADAESLRDALTSLLTLENMGKMKGVLSDSDMKVLRQASTTLNGRMGDAAAKAELERIVQVMGRVGGQMPPMNLSTSRDGAGAAPVPKRMRFDRTGKPIP